MVLSGSKVSFVWTSLAAVLKTRALLYWALTMGLVCLPAQGARFRNHPDVVYRPTICTALLSEMLNQENERPSISRLLNELSSDLSVQVSESYQDLNRQVDPQKLKKPFLFDSKRIKSTHDVDPTLASAAYRTQQLAQFLQDQKMDQIIWVTSATGSDAIQEKIRKRKERLLNIQSEVRREVRRLLPEFRASNILFGTVSALTYLLILDGVTSGLGDLNLRELVLPAIFGLAAYAEHPRMIEILKEFGVYPIEPGRDQMGTKDSLFNTAYINHLNKMSSNVANFGLGDVQIYSDSTRISTIQFQAMKSCKSDSSLPLPLEVATSCVIERLTHGDLIFGQSRKELAALDDRETELRHLDPRWSAPTLYFDDILMNDSATGEPVLMSLISIFANPTSSPKKKKLVTEPKKSEKSYPGLQPQI